RPALALLVPPLRGARVAYHHHERMPGPAIARAVRAAARRAELVVTISRHAADELGVAGAVVVPPGIDVERFAGVGTPAISDEVLVLGALVGWKRPDVAVEAVALARRRLPSLRLRFGGAPFERPGMLDRLQARVEELGVSDAVEFAGEVDAVQALARA